MAQRAGHGDQQHGSHPQQGRRHGARDDREDEVLESAPKPAASRQAPPRGMRRLGSGPAFSHEVALEVRSRRSGRTLTWDGRDANLLDFAETRDAGCHSKPDCCATKSCPSSWWRSPGEKGKPADARRTERCGTPGAIGHWPPDARRRLSCKQARPRPNLPDQSRDGRDWFFLRGTTPWRAVTSTRA